MSIRKMPGFETYGIDEQGEMVVRSRDGSWRPIHQGAAISMRNGNTCTTVTRTKFRFCIDKQINPTSFDARKYVVTKDGEFITRRELNLRSANIRESRKTVSISIVKIKDEIRWLDAALKFYNGDRDTLVDLMESFHPSLVKITMSRANVPKSFADVCSVEAEYALLCALGKGSVTNTKRWLTQKAVCLCREAIGKTAFRLEEWGTINSNE